MKTFKCRDGNSRVFSKREFVFSLNDLAMFNLAVEYLGVGEDEAADAIAKMTSKTKILDRAWDCIFTYGTENPHYRVGDHFRDGGEEAVERVKAHVKTFFPELN